MRIPYKLLSIAFIHAFIFGCSSKSIQNVAKPDINKPINENETIIQLKRADYFHASLNNVVVVANETLIGELANADELVWISKANRYECITLEHEASFVEALAVTEASMRTGMSISQRENFLRAGISFEELPIPYKCFYTSNDKVIKLIYDFDYPETRFSRPFAFLTVFKQSPTYDKDYKVAVNVINSIAPDKQSVRDIESALKTAIKKQFGKNITSSSSKTIELKILDYQVRNTDSKSDSPSVNLYPLIKVKVVIKENNQIVETFITRPIISRRGTFSVEADDNIFDEVAEDIYLHLFGKSS